MAYLVSKLWAKIKPRKNQLRIMIIGLDNSGKTSLVRRLSSLSQSPSSTVDSPQRQSSQQPSSSSVIVATSLDTTTSRASGAMTSPTIGYNYLRIQYRGIVMTVLDFSGQNRYRNLWQEFYSGVDAIVFVVDSSDLIRFVVVRDELETLLSHKFFVSLYRMKSRVDVGLQGSTSEGKNSSTNSPLLASLQEQLDFGTPEAAPVAQSQLNVCQGKLIQTPLVGGSTGTHGNGIMATLISRINSTDKSGKQSTTTPAGKTTTSSASTGIGSSASRGKGTNSASQRTKVPILFLANKTDLPNSVDSSGLVKALNLVQVPSDRHPWSVFATSAKLGSSGLTEAFDWLLAETLTPS